MTHASTFSGIGGPEVAAAMLGWDNLFHCEINSFGRSVLQYWFPNSISYEDITKTDFSQWRGQVDVLTGGFPCQPFSYAGKRRGSEDDRYLWPFMLRCIEQVRPTWFVGENVAGITTMVLPGEDAKVGEQTDLFGEGDEFYEKHERYVLQEIIQNLERAGYSVQPFVIPACAVGAPHRRDRVFIVAHRNSTEGLDTDTNSTGGQTQDLRRESGQRGANRQDSQQLQSVLNSALFGNGDNGTLKERVQSRPATHSDNFQRDGMLRTPRKQWPLRDQSEDRQIIPQARHGVDLLSDACVSCQHRTSTNSPRHGRRRLQRDSLATQQMGTPQRVPGDSHRPCGKQSSADTPTESRKRLYENSASIGGRNNADTHFEGLERDASLRVQGHEGRGQLDGIRKCPWTSRETLQPEQRWRTFPSVSPVHRGNDGLPFNVDYLTIPFVQWKRESLKAYGNSIVPQVIFEIFRAIDIIEKSNRCLKN